jgi:hypothetical protein
MLQTQTLPTSMVQPVNVVSLDQILSPYEPAFQAAVREALLGEGFDMMSPLPNLQLAREILGAIHWLGESGYDKSWESFRQFLEWAGLRGVLVNLGYEPTYAMGA